MSTAARCWWASVFWRAAALVAALWLPIFCLLCANPVNAQSSGTARPQNPHRLIEAAVQALGGPAWLNLRTFRIEASRAAFFQGRPTGAVADITIEASLPSEERVELARGKVIELYAGNHAWEITYKGKRALPTQRAAEIFRRRDHSLGTILRRWTRNPATTLIDEGQTMVDRHLVDKILLIDADDDAATLEIDTENHLPVRLSFDWRDPQFHDENTDAVEYDNYQRVDGIATPFTVTWTHNGETVRQRFLDSVEYNPSLPPNLFNPDIAAAHLK